MQRSCFPFTCFPRFFGGFFCGIGDFPGRAFGSNRSFFFFVFVRFQFFF